MALVTIYPTAGQVQARDRVTAVLSVADPTAVKLSTELEAATSLAVECFLRDFNPDATTETVEAPDRYCSDQKFSRPGKTTWAPIELNYVYRPSEADTTDNNKAYKTLVAGLTLWIIQRPDYPKTLPFAVGQFYNAFQVTLDAQIPSRSGDASDASSEWQIKQMGHVQQMPILHKPLVA